jgi:tungstate transport system substrate-binding protein
MFLLAAAFLLAAPLAVVAQERFITVASTTSTQDSGLYDHLLPMFTKETGIEVRVVALGTGQAIKVAQQGDADVLLVHDKATEERFVAEGYGVARFDLMYNDFVIIGPSGDPAKIAGQTDAIEALRRVAAAKAPFASRGDDSGTHRTELRLWREAGIDVKAASGTWYRELGSGMGPTLNTAAGMDAYVVADRGTWIKFKNRRNLVLLVEGDRRLFNQYGVILVNPERHPHVKRVDGQAFIDWLISPKGQTAIAKFTIDGEPAFFPNSKPGS